MIRIGTALLLMAGIFTLGSTRPQRRTAAVGFDWGRFPATRNRLRGIITLCVLGACVSLTGCTREPWPGTDVARPMEQPCGNENCICRYCSCCYGQCKCEPRKQLQ